MSCPIKWKFDAEARSWFGRGVFAGGYITLWTGMTDAGYTYKIPVFITGYRQSIIVHVVVSGTTIKVFAPNLTDLRHVYEDKSLCMWHPADENERKWSYANGLLALLDLTALHLFKELWCKETGLWPGEEVH